MEKTKVYLLVVTGVLLLLAGADGATLRVDFDGLEEGSEAGETQADYESFRGPGSNGNVELDVTVTYIDALMAEDVTVRLIAQRWKKRSAITGGDETAISLGNLLRDFAGPTSGKSALLSLAFPPGVHEIALNQHYKNRTAGEFALVVVTDADGPRDPVELVSGYGSTEASPPLVFTTTIRSDGINEVTFVYDNTDTTTSNAFPINGFVLTTEAIPHAVDPNPTNGVTGVGPETVLSWACAGGVCNSFNLYLDTDSELGSPDVIMGLIEPFHNAGVLEVATKYYWRIDTVHDSGTTEGSVWNFTTAGLAQNPWPADGASAIRTDIELVWTGDSLAESYDVYIDTAEATTHVARVTEPNLVVSLEFGTTYYWRVVELDGEGRAIAEGNVWSFATRRRPVVNFDYQGVALHYDDMQYMPENDLIHPSIIKAADHIADPLGTYYMYFSPHLHTGIFMAYSDSMDGPWVEHGTNLISGAAAPDIRWIEEAGTYYMWAHKNNGHTDMWSTTNGIDFTFEGIAVHKDNIGSKNATYTRVYEHGIEGIGNKYIMLYTAKDESIDIRST